MSTINQLLGEDGISLKGAWIAECQSLQPDRSLRFPRISTAWDAFAALYLLSHLEASYWITDDIHRTIAQQAYHSNYEGEWEAVQEILEQYPHTPKEFYDAFLKRHSSDEFFGNLVKRANRLSRGISFKRRDPHGPIRWPQRHRGYNDKGTLRPPHQTVEPIPGEVDLQLMPERIDRRKNVGHPLLYDPG